MRRIALIQILGILLLIGRGEGCLPLFPPETTAPPPTTTAQPTCTEATTTSEGKLWFITVSTAALEVLKKVRVLILNGNTIERQVQF